MDYIRTTENGQLFFEQSTEFLQIPSSPSQKVLKGRDMEEGEFSFVLLPIKIDGSYNEADPAQQTLTNPAASANEPVTFNFLLKYIPEDTANPPYRDTDQNPVFYYLVYEKQGTAENDIYSDLQYVVKVTLSKDQSGDFTATSKYYQYDGSGPLPDGATNNLQQSTSLTTAKTDVPQI